MPPPSKSKSASEANADELLAVGALALGIRLGAREIAAFRLYREAVVRWSLRINLTALATPTQIVQQGFLDSLACARLLPVTAQRILDVGSGAGFPAIPLALLKPDAEFTLVEAARKKITFLRHIVRQLELPQVHVRAARIETLVGALAGFDVALARAVAPLPEVAGLVRPFLQPGGVFLAQVGSGGEVDEAVNLVCRAGFAVVGKREVPIEFGKPGRRIIALQKSVAS